MRTSKLVLLVVGTVLALAGLGMLVGGTALGIAYGTQRDADGFFTSPTGRVTTPTAALVSEELELFDAPGLYGRVRGDRLATVRIEVTSAGEIPVFVGVAPTADVERYLGTTAHDVATAPDRQGDTWTVERRREGAATVTALPAPGEQPFWTASTAGTGTRTLTWDVQPGTWTVVVMNASGQPGVEAGLVLGARVPWLLGLAIGLGLVGLGILAGAVAMIVAGATGLGTHAAPETAPWSPALAPDGTALRLEGHIDPDLSRWQWLVKWFLAIPHFVVLAFLWVAFAVLTFVAFVNIVFTGRYPRRIFDFNVGVLRWTWRVGFYATSALGTDRYPPFTLGPVAGYPATLDVAYPERLSRGLVWVKWLLALPHLLIVAILTATWGWSADNGGSGGLSLLGLLMLIVGVSLLFSGRYPGGLFDFVMGINRWAFRTFAYVALMTDRYPPFRLDQGGSEPGKPLPPPPRPATGGMSSPTDTTVATG